MPLKRGQDGWRMSGGRSVRRPARLPLGCSGERDPDPARKSAKPLSLRRPARRSAANSRLGQPASLSNNLTRPNFNLLSRLDGASSAFYLDRRDWVAEIEPHCAHWIGPWPLGAAGSGARAALLTASPTRPAVHEFLVGDDIFVCTAETTPPSPTDRPPAQQSLHSTSIWLLCKLRAKYMRPAGCAVGLQAGKWKPSMAKLAPANSRWRRLSAQLDPPACRASARKFWPNLHYKGGQFGCTRAARRQVFSTLTAPTGAAWNKTRNSGQVLCKINQPDV